MEGQAAFDRIRDLACYWRGQIDFDALSVLSCDLIVRPPGNVGQEQTCVDRNKHVWTSRNEW